MDAGVGHDLGLSDLGAGDALSASRELEVGDGRGFVRLSVRPEILSAAWKCSASRSMLYSSASRSTKRTGVSMASRVMPMCSVVIIRALWVRWTLLANCAG